MTKAQIDLAHKTVGDLGICARAADQYVNARLATVMRTAASLLQAMVDEYEQAMPAKHAPSDVYRIGLTGGDDHG